MGINIDPESLKSLAEDIDLTLRRSSNKTDGNITSLENKLLKLIDEINNTISIKYFDVVTINGAISAGSHTVSHSLGVVPSVVGASCSGRSGSGSTPDITVTGKTSTTVTVYLADSNSKNAVIVLKR